MRNSVKISSLITALLLAVLFSPTTQAQVLPKFGVKGGLNYSTFNNTDDVEYKPGFVVGAFVDIPIPATPVSVQPEVLYATYGTNIKDTDASINISYLQIPVLLKFGFPTPAASPNVFFGPYMGFKMKSEIKNDDISFNLEDETEDTDFGVVVGVGVDITKIRVALRYTAGLTNVAKSGFNDDSKNGALALTVGISF